MSLINNIDTFLVGLQQTGNSPLLTFTNFTPKNFGFNKTTIDYSDKIADYIIDNENKKENVTLKFKKNIESPSTYVKFGSVSEKFKIAIQNIILNYPASLYVNRVFENDTFFTAVDITYIQENDTTSFKIPSGLVVNNYNIVYSQESLNTTDNIKEYKNFYYNFKDFVLWFNNETYPIIDYTPPLKNNTGFLELTVLGKPFDTISLNISANFHLKPNDFIFNSIVNSLGELESYILKNKQTNSYNFNIKIPIEVDENRFELLNKEFILPLVDNHNVLFQGIVFEEFILNLLDILSDYDRIKTDTIVRYLVPKSVIDYDGTDKKNMETLLRIYGRNFDEINNIIEGFLNLFYLSYQQNIDNNDLLLYRIAENLSLNTYDIVNSVNLLENLVTEQVIKDDVIKIPKDVNFEIWNKILNNINFIFKSKGTRKVLEFLFDVLGLNSAIQIVDEYVFITKHNFSRNFNSQLIKTNNLPNLNTSTTNKFQDKGYFKEYENIGFVFNAKIDNDKTDIVKNDTIINNKLLIWGIDLAKNIESDIFCFNNINLNFRTDVDFDIKINYQNEAEIPTYTDEDVNFVEYTYPVLAGFDDYITSLVGKWYPKSKDNLFKRETRNFLQYLEDTFKYFVDARNHKVIYNYGTILKLYNRYLKNLCRDFDSGVIYDIIAYQTGEENLIPDYDNPDIGDLGEIYTMSANYFSQIFNKQYANVDCYNISLINNGGTICIQANRFSKKEFAKYLNIFQTKYYDLIKSFIPATTIQYGGNIVRNSIYTQQKFQYKKGINYSSEFEKDITQYNNSFLEAQRNSGYNFQTINYFDNLYFTLYYNNVLDYNINIELLTVNTETLLIDEAIPEDFTLNTFTQSNVTYENVQIVGNRYGDISTLLLNTTNELNNIVFNQLFFNDERVLNINIENTQLANDYDNLVTFVTYLNSIAYATNFPRYIITDAIYSCDDYTDEQLTLLAQNIEELQTKGVYLDTAVIIGNVNIIE